MNDDSSKTLAKNKPSNFLMRNPENELKFKSVLKNILPYIGTDEGKIILTEVMIALKIEGVIGKQLSKNDSKMVKIIKESILAVPTKKQEALSFAQNLLAKPEVTNVG
ncbi:hypothetical protein HOG98_10120 [bacterium]|nr:hypothetical protein [bacterium]